MATFLRSQAEAILAMDFIETITRNASTPWLPSTTQAGASTSSAPPRTPTMPG
ncbi:hypothetical protein [Kutzneria sp. 744]|uniref:hypothetical protein n=1 Tax=Kutzneria sp. (strain 744) TaxID=345341 RepID=UPI0004AD3CF4|nr:hypothetical protein [Kutzneria sp. 744]